MHYAVGLSSIIIFTKFYGRAIIIRSSFHDLKKTLWDKIFYALIVMWEVRKIKLYGNVSCPSIAIANSSLIAQVEIAGAQGKFRGIDKSATCNCTCTHVNTSY